MSDVVEQVIQRHPEVKNEGIPEVVPTPGHFVDNVVEHACQTGHVGIFEFVASQIEDLDFVLLGVVFCYNLVVRCHLVCHIQCAHISMQGPNLPNDA